MVVAGILIGTAIFACARGDRLCRTLITLTGSDHSRSRRLGYNLHCVSVLGPTVTFVANRLERESHTRMAEGRDQRTIHMHTQIGTGKSPGEPREVDYNATD